MSVKAELPETSFRKKHWENVYGTNADHQVSWYQEVPETSINLIKELNLNKEAAIIDVGGGNSNLTAHLLKQGFNDLTVLDISAKALERTRGKMGSEAARVNWIVSDVLAFEPERKYDLWHDRATFHFLTRADDVAGYIARVCQAIKPGGYLVLGTFSKSGPEKCSGLNITQYSADELQQLFGEHFTMVNSLDAVHQTPFNTEQEFVFAVFRKK